MSLTEVIRVEKNVPIPQKSERGGRRSKYPWDYMDVGDSFLFPRAVKKNTAASLVYKSGKNMGRKFTIRIVSEGIRCWRLR